MTEGQKTITRTFEVKHPGARWTRDEKGLRDRLSRAAAKEDLELDGDVVVTSSTTRIGHETRVTVTAPVKAKKG